ncbi:Chromatin assembly factor 1 subunit B [Bulinus truncatus]|nr:Chromatin assembly factor 1 subunit B [Bulinus truncatus]
MKVITPEFSWHERDPVYSVDFQPGQWPIQRLASGGVDKIVRIWQMTLDSEGKAVVDFLSNLRRHTATVNVVRFSKNGELLATAGDDTAIVLWKLNDAPLPANSIFADDEGEEDKESWVCHKVLRGHLLDVADLSWSKDSRYLVSGSVDNSAIVWDVVKDTKLALFNEHKSYVQGVSFDPLGKYIATLSADRIKMNEPSEDTHENIHSFHRSLRLYNLSSKTCVNNVSKMSLPAHLAPAHPSGDAQTDTKPKSFRIFHDDSLRSFFRRLEFSPDGQLLVTPAGCMELGDGKIINSSYVFARGAFSKPAMYLPSVEKSTTVVRINPQLFQLSPVEGVEASESDQKPWVKHKSLFCLPYRIVFAVATEDSVIIYDTQQTMPVGLLKHIHYHQISDLSWTSDGKSLIVSSTDGFCTVATFEDNELGIPYAETSPDQQKTNLVCSPSAKVILDVSMEVEELKTPEKSSLPFSNYSDSKLASTQNVSPAASASAADVKSKTHQGTSEAPVKQTECDISNASASNLSDSVSSMKIAADELKPTDSSDVKSDETSKKEEKTEVQKKRRIQLITLAK